MTMIQPRRFQLSAEQLATALARAGVQPTSRANLPALPAPAKTDRGLKSSGVLGAAGDLLPDVRAALRSVADPVQVIVVLANRAGTREWTQTTMVRGMPDDPFVMQAMSDKAFDFAILGSVTQATVALDALLDVTAFGSNGTSESFDLDLPGFGALVAGADVVQESRVRAWLSREVDLMPVQLTPEQLEDQLARGLDGQDTRWAVTAAMIAGPARLDGMTGRMAGGLTTLLDTKLVEPGDGGYVLTDAGRSLAFAFGKVVTSGSVSFGLAAPGEPVSIGHLSVFRTPAEIWMASWTGLAGPAPSVRLWSPPAETAIRVLRGLLQPPQASSTSVVTPSRPSRRRTAATPAGGADIPPVTPVRRSAASRAADPTGGRKVAAAGPGPGAGARAGRRRAAATPTADPATTRADVAPAGAAPPPQTWAPTHRVPSGGLSAWSVPDPATEVAARLDAGLEVQLVEVRADWGHIVCSNTWEAWVDARRLEELS